MAISIIMDVVLVGIIVLAAYRGFRKGIIASVIGIVSLVVAIYGANLLAVTFSGEFVGVLEPFVSGIVDSTEAKILSYGSNADAEESDYVPTEPVKGEDTKSADKVSYSILKKLGLDDKIADGIATEVSKVTDTVSSRMNTSLTQKICEKLSFIAVFVIAFALIMIIFAAIGNMLDLVFGLPGLENINHILGGILGAAKGIAIVIVICCVCRYLGVLIGSEIVENTWIMKRLMENNLIANLLKI